MYQCPYCNELGIHGLRKWVSSIQSPAECKKCGAFSAVPVVNSSGIPAASALPLTAGGFLAAALKSSTCFWLSVIAVVAFYVWRWHKAPLVKISTEQRDSARTLGKSATLLAVLVGIISR